MGLIKLADLPPLLEHPVMITFTGYVLSQYSGLPSTRAYFEAVDLKFGAQEINYCLVLEDGKGNQFEFFIICDSQDKGVAMASRMLKNGVVAQNSLSFTQYEYLQYDLEVVL